MKKFTGLLTMILMLVVSITYGQDKSTSDNYAYKNALDIAYETSFPMGTYSDAAASSWFGTSIRYELGMGKKWVGMVTVGYLSFGDKNYQSFSAVPLMLGAKFHFTKGWYGMAETGLHFFNNSGITTEKTSFTEWGYSLGTGYEIPLGKLLSLDVSTKYQYNIENMSYWNTRIGLMFKI